MAPPRFPTHVIGVEMLRNAIATHGANITNIILDYSRAFEDIQATTTIRNVRQEVLERFVSGLEADITYRILGLHFTEVRRRDEHMRRLRTTFEVSGFRAAT